MGPGRGCLPCFAELKDEGFFCSFVFVLETKKEELNSHLITSRVGVFGLNCGIKKRTKGPKGDLSRRAGRVAGYLGSHLDLEDLGGRTVSGPKCG